MFEFGVFIKRMLKMILFACNIFEIPALYSTTVISC